MAMTLMMLITRRHGPTLRFSNLIHSRLNDTSSLLFTPSLLDHYVLQINDTLSSESKSPKGSMKPQVTTKKLLSGSNRSSLPRHDDDARKDANILVKGSDEVSKTEDRNSSTSDVASATKESSTLSSERHWGRAHVSFFDVVSLALKRFSKSLVLYVHRGRETFPWNLLISQLRWMRPSKYHHHHHLYKWFHILYLTMFIPCRADVERLETTKSELQNRITEEVMISTFECITCGLMQLVICNKLHF